MFETLPRPRWSDDRLVDVTGRNNSKQLLAVSCLEAFFYCNWKLIAKNSKSATHLEGAFLTPCPTWRVRYCNEYEGWWFSNPENFRSFWFYHPTYTHARLFTLNELVSLWGACQGPHMLNSQVGCCHCQVQWQKEPILKSSCVMVCPSGKLGSRLTTYLANG